MDNYKNIIESLRPFNIKFNYIWCAEFTDYTNKVINHFVAKTENNEIFLDKKLKLHVGFIIQKNKE